MAAEERWVIAVPSFDRVEAVGKKTLTLLKQAGISPSRIFVFADPTQHKRYEKQLQPFGVSVMRGDHGVKAQRNAIMRHFPPGTRIVEMDDDIDGLDVTTGPQDHTPGTALARVPDANFEAVVDHLWSVMLREGCSLWGLYGIRNSYFMSHTYTIGLAKSTAQVQGYINPGEAMSLSVNVMEDYERCLAFYAQGKPCVRVNYLAARTQNKGRGGCASAFTEAECVEGPGGRKTLRHPRYVEEAKAAEALKQRYPSFVTSIRGPQGVLKVVPVHGEVEYHAPGWRLGFKNSLGIRNAGDVVGDYVRLLGLSDEVIEAAKAAAAAAVTQESSGRRPRAATAAADEDSDNGEGEREAAEETGDDIGLLILNSLKVDDLRQRCRDAGADTKGTKSALIDRLLRLQLEDARRKAEEAERRAKQLAAELAKERKRKAAGGGDRQLTELLEQERRQNQELHTQLGLKNLEGFFAEAVAREEQERLEQARLEQEERLEKEHGQSEDDDVLVVAADEPKVKSMEHLQRQAMELLRAEAERSQRRRQLRDEAQKMLLGSHAIKEATVLRRLMPPEGGWSSGLTRRLHPDPADVSACPELGLNPGAAASPAVPSWRQPAARNLLWDGTQWRQLLLHRTALCGSREARAVPGAAPPGLPRRSASRSRSRSRSREARERAGGAAAEVTVSMLDDAEEAEEEDYDPFSTGPEEGGAVATEVLPAAVATEVLPAASPPAGHAAQAATEDDVPPTADVPPTEVFTQPAPDDSTALQQRISGLLQQIA